MDQAQTVGVGDEFTMFPKLAPELRIEIWKLALPEPRTIAIDTNHYQFTITESEKSPILLHVNKEARSVALRRYQPSFSTVDGSPRYFDFTKDTLQLRSIYVESVTLPRLSLGEELSKVQIFKYHGKNIFLDYSQRSLYNKLKPFKSLKNLIVHHTPYFTMSVSNGHRNDEAWWKGVHDRLVDKFERQWEAYTQKLEESDGGENFKGPFFTLMPREYFIRVGAGDFHYVFQ
jgi:hypothetical protein